MAVRFFDKVRRRFNMIKLILALIASGTIVLAVLGVIVSQSPRPLTDLGPAGDFFGGFANPIFAFLAFIGVMIGAFLQQRSLTESRIQASNATETLSQQMAASDRQNFENSLFAMMGLLNDIISQIDVTYQQGKVHHGRDCFPYYRDQILRTATAYASTHTGLTQQQFLRKVYTDVWSTARVDLSHYVRFLYNMIRYIDESEFDADQKYKYVRLIRAQLSDYELAVLFYNCFYEHGQRLKVYVERYALMNNLPDDILIDPKHKALLPPTAYKRSS